MGLRNYSLRSVALIAGVLGRAGERGQQRRLAEAEQGVVTWENPRDVNDFIVRDAEAKALEEAKAMSQATEDGSLEEKPLQREDFLTDSEVLEEMFESSPTPLPEE